MKWMQALTLGYSFACKNCRKSGEGIGAYVKDVISYTRREDLECEDLKMLWLKISFKITKSFLISIIYHPLILQNTLQELHRKDY